MICLIHTPRFERRFRPRRANDSIPVRPLIDVLLYWCCTTFGGLFASAGITALLAYELADIPFDRGEIVVMAVLALTSPLLFAVAIHAWRRLNR